MTPTSKQTPSDQRLNQMFGFVTPEDRQRWQGSSGGGGLLGADGKPKAIFGPKLAELGTKLSEQLASEQRQAARFGESQQRENRRPRDRTRTTTITEHIHEEEADGYEYGD